MNIQLARIALVLGLVATLLIGCQPLQPISRDAPLDDAAEAEFLDAVMAAETAFQSEDPVQAASYYTEDAVSMPPGFPPSHGKETIQADLAYYFDSFDMEREFNLVSYTIDGNTATRTGAWTQTLTPTDGSDPFVETGQCVFGWEKVDGEWKIAWEIWNTYDQ